MVQARWGFFMGAPATAPAGAVPWLPWRMSQAQGLPALFPHAECLHTHISWVWLVGDHAYKAKRPVKLPFLDFATLAARRHFCAEELRLNRRTAPGLYLDLWAVCGPAHAPVLRPWAPDAPWPADGWEVLLRMHRFAQSALWQHRALAGALAPADADALATHVAHFHQALPPLAQAPARGTLHWARESLDGVARHPARPAWLTLQRVQALRERVEGALQALDGWRTQRLAQGWLREGHGDLHLGNLVNWQGGVVAFDALEFEPQLRCIDVMNDAAFAFMDLQAHGLPALAWRFLDGYLAHTGDYAGLRGLRAFAAYRALVRAKVALLSHAPPPIFARYWTLAERLASPVPSPHLVLTMGLSGSGKSTAAALAVEHLAAAGAQDGGLCTGAVRLRSDVERKRRLGLAPTSRPGHAGPASTLYSADTTRRTYQHVQAVAAELLGFGQSVVVDAACLRQAEREALRQVAAQAGARFTLLECLAPLETMHTRLAQRQAANTDPSDANATVLAQQTQWAEPVPTHWAPVHRQLVNNSSLNHLRQQVAAALG